MSSLCAVICDWSVTAQKSRACHLGPAGRVCCQCRPWQCDLYQKLEAAHCRLSVISRSQPCDAAQRTLCALQDEYADEPGTVIASDFYHSNELMPLSDEAIINRVVSNMGACEPAFLGAQVSTVGKASVLCFGCGSVRLHTPCQQPSEGDWWVSLKDVAWQCRGCTGLVSSLAAMGSTGQYC